MKARSILTLLLSILALALQAQALLGDYTINSALVTGGTNFQSITDFAAALNANGVAGHVVATIEPGSGPYQEQVIFDDIDGTGPNATITLEGSGETVTAATTGDDAHVVRLKDCEYFTINNLHLVCDPASGLRFYGIHVFSTGSHITISNCSADLTGETSTLYGAYIVSGSTTSILEGGLFHDITITNNSANGGGYGASVFGLAAPNLATNIEVSHNEFLNAHSNAVYIRETDGVNIHHNFIDKTTTNVTSWNAIQIAQNANINARIYDNYIQVSQTANGTMPFRAIYLFNGTGHRVYNNIITNIQLEAGDVTAIEIRTAGTAPEIYFNTISIDKPVNTSGDLAGIKESLSNTNAILRNNLISITQPCSAIKSGLVIGTTANPQTAFDSDYNIIYVPEGNVGQKGTLSPILYPTLATWQGVSGQDDNSYAEDPFLLSPILPTPTNTGLDNKGTPIGGITLDHFGVNRGTPPDIGAIEFGGCPPPSPPTAIFGETELCENSTGVVFSIDPIPGATNYTWTAPTGATITSGQGTTSITVDFGTLSGNISAAAEDTCGMGAPAFLPITLLSIPDTPGGISGPTSLCPNSVVTITVPEVPGALTYTWTVPADAVILSGQGTPVIQIQFGEASGNVTVTANNDCGSSAPGAFAVQVFPVTTVTLDIPVDTLCLNAGPYTLTGGNPTDGTYSGPGVTDGAFDPQVAGLGQHVITLTYEDEFGCVYTATDVIDVDACASTDEKLTVPNLWSVVPNPTTGILVLAGEGPLPTHIRVSDTQGRTLLTVEQTRELDLSALPAGLYFLAAQVGDRVWIGKVIKE